MNLQDMVLSATGNIQSKPRETQSASELLGFYTDPSELLAAGRRAEHRLQSASRKQAREIAGPLAARFAASDRSGEIGSGAEIFAALFDFLEDPDMRQPLLRAINRASNRLELAMVLQETAGRFSFLEYVWGEDLQAKVADLTSTDPRTVSEWLAGKTPALYNQEIILAATTVFHQLCRECEMSASEARRYFEEVRFGHKADRRLSEKCLWDWITKEGCWLHKRFYFPDDLRDHITSLGGDPEVFEHNFRNRFLM